MWHGFPPICGIILKFERAVVTDDRGWRSIPSTLAEMTLNANHTLVLPRQKAEKGLTLVKEAILDYLGAYADGLRNADLAHYLGLGSDHEGQQKIILHIPF
jgi:hypothetical protein